MREHWLPSYWIQFFGLIVGDACRPKYFGSRKLVVKLGEKKFLSFYWQDSYKKYVKACSLKGLFSVYNPSQLSYVEIGKNHDEAEVHLHSDSIYAVKSINIRYEGVELSLSVEPINLYSIPKFILKIGPQDVISDFPSLSEVWMLEGSSFRFTYQWWGLGQGWEGSYCKLAYFEQRTTMDYKVHLKEGKYQLSVYGFVVKGYQTHTILAEKGYYQLITEMKKYQQTTDEGIFFVGVQFRDQRRNLIMNTKTCYAENLQQIGTEISDKFGGIINIPNEDWSPESYTAWVSIGGPVKGSYWAEAQQDFGLRVDDPCKAVDNLERISMNTGHTAYRDLRYHDGTNSTFWLQKCTDLKALRLTQSVPFLTLDTGNLLIHATPADICTRLVIIHRAPDDSLFTNVIFLHMLGRHAATIEKCSPQEQRCKPRTFHLTSVAGQISTEILYAQDSVTKYLAECKEVLFDLKDAPGWVSLSDASILVIDAPNLNSVVRDYSFYISIWQVFLTVKAPCHSVHLKNLDSEQVSLYIDQQITLTVEFQEDAARHSWKESCGLVREFILHNAPNFVTVSDQEIQIWPVNKEDVGSHIVLLQLKIEDGNDFFALSILVKLPITYISTNMKPFFGPALEDETKPYKENWRDPLSSIRDPAFKFAYVTKSRISPRRAHEFIKTILSSDAITNRTLIFAIDEDDWREKTGNVSFFVEISAYNQNYSVWQGQTHYTRSADWRWRRSESRFNLTILLKSDYIELQNTRIFCFNGWKRTLTARKNCQAIIYSKNITIDHLGQINIQLGEYFSFPDNFEKLFNNGESDLSSIFKISLAPNKQIDSSNFTFEMVSYAAPEIVEIKRGKKITESSTKELVGSVLEKFMDSDRYETTVKWSPHILIFKITYDYPWNVSVTHTDVLQILLCKQQLPAKVLLHTDSEGCLELIQKVPLQNYEVEFTLTSMVTIFTMIVMVTLIFNHIKELFRTSTVFPFISLTLTPLIALNVFTVSVKLAEVVKFLIKRQSQILNFDFFDIKSVISGRELNNPSLALVGYQFISLYNNMGIVFWFAVVFIVFLSIKWVIYLFLYKVETLSANSKLLKCINLTKNFSGSLYNYLVVNQIVSMTSLVLYLQYEYYEESCFELKCILSKVKISSTTLVKLDFVIAVILIIGQSIHFWRIIVLTCQRRWFAFQCELDQSRVFYPKEHARLMRSGFGKGHDFEMNRERLQQGEYLMYNLKKLEKKQDMYESRFDELQRYLGPQYCHGLEPSTIGFKKCVQHLLLDQTRTYLIVFIILYFQDKIQQLTSIFLVQNLYYGIQLTWIKAQSPDLKVAGWANFAFCMAINYYQLVTLVEVSPKVLNVSGLVINALFFLFLGITLGQPSLLCLKQLVINMKRILANRNRPLESEMFMKTKKVRMGPIRPPNPERQQIIQLEQEKATIKFISGMLSRGLTPVDNLGDGNCVFISLAQIVLGNATQFEFIRLMVVDWLRNFSQKYRGRKNNLSDYCGRMAVNGKPAGELELQVIADICFSVVECYSTKNFNEPVHIIQPLRCAEIPKCYGRIRLWIQPGHCMALIDGTKHQLIQNIPDDSDIPEAVSYSARQVEVDIEATGSKVEGRITKQEVADLYRKFMAKNNLCEKTGLPITEYERIMQAVLIRDREKEKRAKAEEKDVSDREICQLKKPNSIEEAEVASYVPGSSKDRCHGLERKQMPNAKISNNLKNGLPIHRPIHRGKLIGNIVDLASRTIRRIENGLPVPEESARGDRREIRAESQQQLSGQVEAFSAGEEEERNNQNHNTHKITPENDEDSEERRIETQQIIPENYKKS